MVQWLRVVAALIVSWTVIACATVAAGLLLADTADELDGDACIVVLGCYFNTDTAEPGPLILERVRTAARLSTQRHRVFFTGGFGEAASSARLFAELGGVAREVVLESASTTTLENVELVAPLLRARKCRSVVFVTDAFHALRSLMLFRVLLPAMPVRFVTCAITARLHVYALWSMRETLAIAKVCIWLCELGAVACPKTVTNVRVFTPRMSFCCCCAPSYDPLCTTSHIDRRRRRRLLLI